MTPMMRRVLLIVLVLAGLAAVATRFISHDSPPGQPPLGALNEAALGALRDDFNQDADATRIVLLLSPT